jgi:hypothetical protein
MTATAGTNILVQAIEEPGRRQDRARQLIDGLAAGPQAAHFEWRRPIPDDQAEEIAVRFPELTLRTDPAARSRSCTWATPSDPAPLELMPQTPNA